ncbi:iron uptake system protein EfeO [Nocardioides rubriscoriae]|uniref:iron uptake system protein EfeO n=1 Tax=Nocardioides rubriscoriae TaxID=642762 RepID=UPI001B88511A|nr:iron uptake system protein EfeO [Nocardioides rubriscoriae]
MRTTLLLTGVLLAAPVLAGCTDNATGSDAAGSDDRSFTVAASDDACDVSGSQAPSGALRFDVTNTGSQITEFYLLADDGLRIIGEVENIGPGVSRSLTIKAPAGDYLTACKPGMRGDGIRAAFTVTASDDGEQQLSASDQQRVDEALAGYRLYVRDQSAQLLDKTARFVALYKAGQDDRARALYPEARTHWERIETVAESFGDLDPLMDAREADLEPGEDWTGWHRLEKDLWPAEAGAYRAMTPAQRATYADDLLANTRTLDDRIQDLDYTVDAVANGSRGLLEEVASGKVTGEEETWSHTDLWDFQANVDGARVAFEGLEPIVADHDPALAEQLTTRFEQLQVLLDAQRTADGFRLYTDLTQPEVKALADAVNALSEPLSHLTAAIV